MNDALCSAIQFWWDTFGERRNFRDVHIVFLTRRLAGLIISISAGAPLALFALASLTS
jgi:hypothetical protein